LSYFQVEIEEEETGEDEEEENILAEAQQWAEDFYDSAAS